MARMHSRKRGLSGSVKPSKKAVPSWLRYKPKEIEILVAKLAKEGKTSSEIGILMRDIYGVPDIKTLTKKSVTKIMEEHKLRPELPEDLVFLIKKVAFLQKHLESNKQDKAAKRGLLLTESKIKRLVKYYKRTGRIPLEWKFDTTTANMFLE